MDSVDPGVVQAKAQSHRHVPNSSVIILDFGRPTIYAGNPPTYGVQLIRSNQYIVGSAPVLTAAQTFIRWYDTNNPPDNPEHVSFVIATANDDEGDGFIGGATGTWWGQLVVDMQTWLATQPFADRYLIFGGIDIEQGNIGEAWASEGDTRAFIGDFDPQSPYYGGYLSISGVPPYYNFGPCEDCDVATPDPLNPLDPSDLVIDNAAGSRDYRVTGCTYGTTGVANCSIPDKDLGYTGQNWFASDVFAMSSPTLNAISMPEIYFPNTVDSPQLARQWAYISLYGRNHGQSQFSIPAVITECAAYRQVRNGLLAENTPEQGYEQLHSVLRDASQWPWVPLTSPGQTDIFQATDIAYLNYDNRLVSRGLSGSGYSGVSRRAARAAWRTGGTNARPETCAGHADGVGAA